MTAPHTFIFAGGGTGGHLFPALAIAAALRDRLGEENTRALFVCSDRPLDAQILSAEGAEHIPLHARPFSLRPRALARFMRHWGQSVRESRLLIRRLRKESPDAPIHLVAMGGFVAPPVVQAARVERLPIALVNLDAVPGKANRWVAKRASLVVTAARVEERASFAATWTNIGPIVRPQALARGTREDCRIRLGLDPTLPTLLICGGSQGAKTINQFILELARAQPGALAGWQLLHQTGAEEADTVSAVYEDLALPAVVAPFVTEMGDWWGAADLAVARSGAGAVAEAWANRVPCLFLPYPFHRDQHQRHNAAALAEAGGAIIETDRIDPAANLQHAGAQLTALLADAPRRDTMRRTLAALGPAEGAARAAELLLKSPDLPAPSAQLHAR